MESNCDFESEIVISGIAGRFPDSDNLDEFWQNLIEGKDMVKENFDRYNVDEYEIPPRLGVLKNLDKFDAEFFSVHAKQATILDPRIRMLLEITYEAILDAGINPTTIQGSRTGVFIGGSEGEAGTIWKRSTTKPNMYGILGNVLSMMANRLSYTFDFVGPSYVIDTACSSSSVALHQALHSIRTGMCDAAIVAGAHIHHDPIASYCFHYLKMTSKDGKCKSFDASADGYVRAEAAVAVYLCKKQVAKRSYATFVHAATNNDGYKEQGITFPCERRQEVVIRQVYDESGVDPLEVDYLEAHGTGTKVGDPEEMIAVTKVFCEGRKGPLLVGAVKSNMGHPEPAAGLCGIAKIVLSHAAGVLPPNLHYNTPNPEIPGLHDGRIQIIDKAQPFNAKYVGLNSMGFGGTNVHILLKLTPREEQEKVWDPPVPVLLLWSGRTEESVESFLEKAYGYRQSHHFVDLTHGIQKDDIPKHSFRGYLIVQPDKKEIQVEQRDSGRAIWFIFTGLGSQWAGMSRDLIKLNAFKRSIEKSAAILLNNHNFDILSLLECGDSTKFENFKNSVVSITTIQVALVDLLGSIGIVPDGIIGHSTGEVAAAYADGCLTQGQAVLTSFARVRAVLESNLEPGTVASVGLTWEDAKRRCPLGVYPAIHNSKENVTIAGPPEVVKDFVKQLESEGVFAKMVRSASFGFHSPLVEESGKLAKVLLEQIIPDPKPRSKIWLSSSVPEDRWDTDLAKYCSADYYVNNGVKPVYFYTTLLHIPAKSIAVEIAPHCFMQTILKQSLPKESVKVGLIHVKSPDNCVYFLDAIGKCFLAGVNVDVAALYEPLQYPVSPTTPNISSLIKWDHSATYDVPHHKNELSRQKGIKFSFHLLSEQDTFLEGHSIEGKVVFPATGYLYIVWRFFAQQHEYSSEHHPVVFEDVRIERATLLSKSQQTDLLINIFPGSGKFEISEADVTICTGVVRNVDESSENEMLSSRDTAEVDMNSPFMTKDDFYKELHLRGYGHTGLFQGIHEADMKGMWAKAKWQGNWIVFMDSILQAFILRDPSRELYVPIRLEKMTIDPDKVRSYLEANDNIITIKALDELNTGYCPGMEVRGITFAKFNQKLRQTPPATQAHVFLPLLESPGTRILSGAEALEASLEIAVENSFGAKMIFTEILKNPSNMISHLAVDHWLLKFPNFESRTVNESGEVLSEENLEAGRSKAMTLQDAQSRDHGQLGFVDHPGRVSEAAEMIVPGGFVLYKGPSLEIALPNDMLLISAKSYRNEETQCSYFLLRKLLQVPSNTRVITTDAGFSWVEIAKKALKILPELGRLYFVSACPRSGIIGFVKCLVREATSEKIRCYHSIDPIEIDFENPSEILSKQIRKDIVFNVYKDGAWGAMSNLTISKEEFRKQRHSSYAYANALVLGELSSLSWIESPLKLARKDLVEVHYASLNFRDIMLASGKLVQDALTGEAVKSDCVLGLEFSGIYQGKRVCGMGSSECLATHIDPQKLALLDIPENWTFEEAATVPCVYVTVYLALILRGKMQPGESILIHAGSGGVGQAAIQVALSMNCKVFTTVSTEEKRNFLKERFPSLTDASFSNSRDAKDFERHIQAHTKGRGVNLVLNSLAQDKLFASIRCLAKNGRFLEIGKFDMFNNTKIGMSILSRGVSIIGILADDLIDASGDGNAQEIDQMKEFMRQGMTSGTIRPLTFNVFKHDQLEEAFRFMAQGKHIGKVMIQVKEDGVSSASIPAYPRTYFHPEKSYAIIGGLGGMGFELIGWMVERGARKIVISSRSGTKSTYHEYHLSVWGRQGVTFFHDQSNVSALEGTRNLLENAKKLGPIGGIFNVAVVLKDGLFENQTEANFNDVVKCKADATIHLDGLSRELAPELDHFVVFSSIVSARGNPGQTNYAFANSVMERICEERKADGLPALAVQWGAVGDVGVFHRTMKDKVVFGIAPQKLKSCFETLDLCLQRTKDAVVSSFVPFQRNDLGKIDPNDSLVNIAANILGIKDISKINQKTPLIDLGMDSLMAAELSQVLQSRTNIQLSQKDYAKINFEKLAELDAKGGGLSVEDNQNAWEPKDIVEKILTLKHPSVQVVNEMQSLRTKKEKIFLVHPMDGTVVMLEELVTKLNAHVYGIECAKEAPLKSIEKLAAFYLEKIKEVQPQGPYKLGGYSFGTSVALEMALQLEGQNETVDLLLLIDGSPRWKFHIDKYEGGEAKRQEWENTLLIGYLKLYKSRVSLNEYKELSDFGTLAEKFNYLAELLHDAYPEVSMEEIKDSASAFLARAECARVYDPTGKAKARTVLVKALMAGTDQGIAYDYGLSENCEGDVEVVGIEGNHYCFYEKPIELGIPAVINKIIG